MTRRGALAALSAGTMFAQENARQFGRLAPKRAAPMICGYSGNLARIQYAELGNIAQQIGYEGIDLTVMIGGHVDPRITNVDLVRAFEVMRGAGLEVPMISTNITMAAERTTYPVLYLTGNSQVPLFRLGFWQFPEGGSRQQTLASIRNEVAQIAMLGQRCQMAAMFPNRRGYVGESLKDAQAIIGDMDPRWVGYYFDPSEAGDGWEDAFRNALPRVKAIAVQDFKWDKSGSEPVMSKCPLGEGVVDWPKLFSIAAAAKFTGPLSIHMEYKPSNEPAAMEKDLAFVRKHVDEAWLGSAQHN